MPATGPRQRIQMSDLPDDMQVLLTDVVAVELGEEGLRVLEKHHFTIRHVPLPWFPQPDLDTGERGPRHASEMTGQDLPPIIVCGTKWVDGRHRVWALRKSGHRIVRCIDLAEIGCSYPFAHLGMLRGPGSSVGTYRQADDST